MKESALEYCKDEKKCFDFFLEDYDCLKSSKGMLKSKNLLFHSFEIAGCSKKFYDLINKLEEKVGFNNTVWGLKQKNNDLFWELYFYNHRKTKLCSSISCVLNSVKSLFSNNIVFNENLPYFMFSMDISSSNFRMKKIDRIYVYCAANKHSEAVSYSVEANRLHLENHYNLYYPDTQIEQMRNVVEHSIFVDKRKIDMQKILIPELLKCKKVCMARKQFCDAIYYSGITIDQLIFFLKRFKYPSSIVFFIEQKKHLLDYMLYDVGIDYRMQDKKLCFSKTGYYGYF